ncbi:MAG: hypothetical protein ABIF09_02770 [Gemmatimonadota bacterium]
MVEKRGLGEGIGLERRESGALWGGRLIEVVLGGTQGDLVPSGAVEVEPVRARKAPEELSGNPPAHRSEAKVILSGAGPGRDGGPVAR